MKSRMKKREPVMNIAIEDIKFLERFAKQEPCSGSVWRMAQEGKTYFEISVAVGHSKESDGVPRREQERE